MSDDRSDVGLGERLDKSGQITCMETIEGEQKGTL